MTDAQKELRNEIDSIIRYQYGHNNESLIQKDTNLLIALINRYAAQKVREARKDAVYDALNVIEWGNLDGRTSEVKALRDRIWRLFNEWSQRNWVFELLASDGEVDHRLTMSQIKKLAQLTRPEAEDKQTEEPKL